MRKKNINTCLLISVAALLSTLVQCTKPYKDYSYERRPIPTDSTPPADTIPVPVLRIPFCAGCFEMDDFILGRWSFTTDGGYACGVIDTAIVSPDRTALTFYGPSQCSSDTGIIFSVFTATALNKNLSNIVPTRTAFYYYDNVSSKDIFISKSGSPLLFTIQEYDHTSRIAKGIFSGFVYTADNKRQYINSGKFMVVL